MPSSDDDFVGGSVQIKGIGFALMLGMESWIVSYGFVLNPGSILWPPNTSRGQRVVRLTSLTLRECGHAGIHTWCQERANAPQQIRWNVCAGLLP
jgi:hypothetical protein